MKKIEQLVKIKLVTKIFYRIFESSPEGHLREPHNGDSHIFDHYKGYESIESAAQAILKQKEEDYGSLGEYIILPMVIAKEIF